MELPDLKGFPSSYWAENAFVASLLVRRTSAFRERTWKLVEKINDENLRYETLIALASEPKHAFNVNFLDAELRASTMPERDSGWTVHLAISDRADHLVEWA